MADLLFRPRRTARTLLGWMFWIALTASAASAGQGPDALIILLGVSTDGTLQVQQLPPPAAGVIAAPIWLPPSPPKGPVTPPPAPPKPPRPPQPEPKPEVGGVVDVFTRLNVRTGPSTDHTILGTLGPGEPVTIIGKSPNGWLNILWRGRKAWICGTYVWTPGEQVRNGAIRDDIRREFGAHAVPPAPRPDPRQNGEAGGGQRTGERQSDGGLKIPLYSQYAVGAKVPSGFCGPTSLKMVLEYHGIKKDINFLGTADVGGATPVYIPGTGAGHQGMLDMLRHCGLKGSYMTHAKSIAWLRQQTNAGHPVVVSVKGNFGGGYTTSGHILVVAGVTSDGRVILNDSAGGKRRIVSGSAFLGAWNSSNRMAIVTQR